MANMKTFSILTTIALSMAVACGGSQKEAEAPAEQPADEDAVNDEMLDLAEGDMPDDGFEEEAAEGAEGEDAPADETAE